MSERFEALYHLGYSLGEQEEPRISVHTSPEHLEAMKNSVAGLASMQDYLGIEKPFSFEAGAYGFEGTGTVIDSHRVAGWTALTLAVPAPTEAGNPYASATKDLISVISTLSAIFRHLNSLHPENHGVTDKNSSQLIIPNLYNELPHNSPYSAKLWATLTPDMLIWTDLLPDQEATEERVRDALRDSYTRAHPSARPDDFEVSLNHRFHPDDEATLSFTYPGDGTGFFGRKTTKAYREGLEINAANNDYPEQQIAILGGLAALNDAVLEL